LRCKPFPEWSRFKNKFNPGQNKKERDCGLLYKTLYSAAVS
jgi:hypothetical protein